MNRSAAPIHYIIRRLLLIVVGGVLLYGAIGKAISPDVFAVASAYLTGWSLETARPVGFVLVVVEFILGSALVFGIWAKPAAWVAGIMIAGFLIPLAMLANDPLAPACGCLGRSSGADANSIGLVRNGLLLLLLGGAMAPWTRRSSVPATGESL